MDPHSPWAAWLYQYGIGGVLFCLSLFLALRTGAVSWHVERDRNAILALVLGLGAFMLVHAAWIQLATG
jgi:hypothetical protein